MNSEIDSFAVWKINYYNFNVKPSGPLAVFGGR